MVCVDLLGAVCMPCAVILTALPVEYLAVRAHLTALQEEIHPKGTIYERGRFASENQVWDVGIVEIGAGNVGAALEAERAIAYFGPDVLLFVGVAGGIKDVVIGDVVASTKIYGYESGKVELRFKPRPEIGLSAYSLEQRARAEARKGDWLRRLTTVIEPTPRVFVAPIAAGEKVIASTASDVFQFLRENYGDAVAVEMEGLGFLEAVRANRGVEAIVIRGISDLIEGKGAADQAGSQEIASLHASAFAFEILAKLESLGVQDNSESVTNASLSSGQFIPGSRCRKVFGREELTETILDHFKTPDSTPILCLGGVAGYGKTEVATGVAKSAIDKSIFDDVAWVSIRESELSETFVSATFVSANRSSELVQWKDVLYDLSRQLNCPADRESVQTHLRDRKWLVVLDNAETSELNDILPKLVKILGPRRALLTSRVNVPLPFVKVVDCPGLSESSSRALLMDEAKDGCIDALLSASEAQIQRLYQLSCGAPLALHFIVGRVRDDEVLDPVLDALEEAKGEVEVFYRFALETAWQRMSDRAKEFLCYMAKADASVTLEELQRVLQTTEAEARESRIQLKRWSMILSNGGRDDLHPWVRRSVRSNLQTQWENSSSRDELGRIAEWKYGV